MIIKRIWFVFNIVIFIPTIDCGKCPPNNTINPCNCEYNWRINCIGDKVINLTHIFQDLSLKLENQTDKEFETFVLSNTAITELEDNSFHDITFKTIRLSNASKLNYISSNAFFPSNTETVRKFVVEGYSSLGNEKYINDTLTAISSLIKLEEIDFSDTNLSIMPSHAFKDVNGFQDKLKTLNFRGNKIKSVEKNAFYYLNSLGRLDLANNSINHIEVHAFDFYNSSKEELYIPLYENKLNDTSIEIGAFTNSKRQLLLDVRWNELTFLNERIFDPILRINSRNRLVVTGNNFTCDCRMFWLFEKRTSIQKQFTEEFKCKDGKDFWSLTDSGFKDCSE